MKSRRLKGILSGLAASLTLAAVAFAPPSVAAPATNSLPAAPATNVSPTAYLDDDCWYRTSGDGRTVWYGCNAGAPETYYRIVLTTCGTSSCQRRYSGFHLQNGVEHVWTPGGWISRVDGFDFTPYPWCC